MVIHKMVSMGIYDPSSFKNHALVNRLVIYLGKVSIPVSRSRFGSGDWRVDQDTWDGMENLMDMEGTYPHLDDDCNIDAFFERCGDGCCDADEGNLTCPEDCNVRTIGDSTCYQAMPPYHTAIEDGGYRYNPYVTMSLRFADSLAAPLEVIVEGKFTSAWANGTDVVPTEAFAVRGDFSLGTTTLKSLNGNFTLIICVLDRLYGERHFGVYEVFMYVRQPGESSRTRVLEQAIVIDSLDTASAPSRVSTQTAISGRINQQNQFTLTSSLPYYPAERYKYYLDVPEMQRIELLSQNGRITYNVDIRPELNMSTGGYALYPGSYSYRYAGTRFPLTGYSWMYGFPLGGGSSSTRAIQVGGKVNMCVQCEGQEYGPEQEATCTLTLPTAMRFISYIVEAEDTSTAKRTTVYTQATTMYLSFRTASGRIVYADDSVPYVQKGYWVEYPFTARTVKDELHGSSSLSAPARGLQHTRGDVPALGEEFTEMAVRFKSYGYTGQVHHICMSVPEVYASTPFPPDSPVRQDIIPADDPTVCQLALGEQCKYNPECCITTTIGTGKHQVTTNIDCGADDVMCSGCSRCTKP